MVYPYALRYKNVVDMIENPRFYIVGAFIRNKLVGVSSLDYTCGKLIGKIDFPKACDTNKLVEIGFTIVHFNYRGRKIMQQLLDYLLEKIKKDGFTWAFAKIHKDNLASSTSCIRKGFYVFNSYAKPVSKIDLQNLANQDFFSPEGKANLDISSQKFTNAEELLLTIIF